jgi:hypothetical protein
MTHAVRGETELYSTASLVFFYVSHNIPQLTTEEYFDPSFQVNSVRGISQANCRHFDMPHSLKRGHASK